MFKTNLPMDVLVLNCCVTANDALRSNVSMILQIRSERESLSHIYHDAVNAVVFDI